MAKRNIIFFGLALSAGLMACGNNGNGTDSNGGMADSSSTNTQMMDSANNMTPAQGMGDSTLYKDSSTGGGATGSGNDGVNRVGGGGTSTGDTARGGGAGNQ